MSDAITDAGERDEAALHTVPPQPDYVTVAADTFLMAAHLHDMGALSRLEYLRARLRFRQALAFSRGEPVPGLAITNGPAEVINLQAYKAKRNGKRISISISDGSTAS